MKLRSLFVLVLPVFFSLASIATAVSGCTGIQIAQPRVTVTFHCGDSVLWEYQLPGAAHYPFAPPMLFLNDRTLIAGLRDLHQKEATDARLGVREYTVWGHLQDSPDLILRVIMRVAASSPVVRFHYELSLAAVDASEQFAAGNIQYFAIPSQQFTRAREVQVSNFQSMTHSYNLVEQDLTPNDFRERSGVIGPILALSDGRDSLVIAYEHGSTVPDAYVEYKWTEKGIAARAVKGNVYPGQRIDSDHPWRSLWFEAGAVSGPIDALAHEFRQFMLHDQVTGSETRRPLVFYNTWNYQERQKWFAHREYLQSINLERALKEIEVAHQIGIDVYVLDTGWYQSTGDWKVSQERFPDGLQQIRQKLRSYGMRLGLWFGPTSAAVSSQIAREHPEWRASWNGAVPPPSAIWGTEPSFRMCMVSPYSHAFAQKVIEVARATGATYFKWDAVDQHACNDPHHDHGTDANTPEDRDASYGFQMIGRLAAAASEINDAVPGAIVDMDVTESGRAFGLQFLSAGKFFLFNNGPYLFDYDLPLDKNKDNWNLFFYPGQARTWVARSPLALDKWLPSTLTLAHYFPDDPRGLQELNIASMILGQDGIWGDLTAISPDGIKRMGELILRYKQVRDDMAEADPVVSGLISGSPEVHEKILARTGRGAVVLFATAPGTYEYTTKNVVNDTHWSSGIVEVRRMPDGVAHIKANFTESGARIVYFGVPAGETAE